MADTPPFPDDLIETQQRLHQARAEYTALCRALPWSVEPLPGWPGAAHPHTGEVTGGREASPGYTPEEEAEERRLWDLVRELSVAVSTHPYWAALEKDAGLVKARMELKKHPKAQPDAASAAGGGAE
ncbi:hypothetical protein AMK27_21480 [Streptomyces sp. CB02009]|uniref:hypothetical protein n=1 Tax=Streptomyces sp. CB02009 TaxID=1703938 RepID=UPI000939EBCF|nr:hypothetical protein [Streptomyces sp. CB02009]OKJ60023.1 hypothetical protein AMK27_21480 [Streptomyces sp. CB02009]